MKKLLILIFTILFFYVSLNGQTINENYDSTLAKSFDADEYGMKNYVFVLLKPGSNKTIDKTVVDSVFGGHMKNINRLAENGSLVVAGPFMQSDKYKGIFILNVETIDEAKLLLETDPAISGKFLEAELYQWYGSAALKEYLKIHKKIEKYLF